MDHFPFSTSSFSSDVDENAVEQLLSQFIDEEVLTITTNPVGKRGSFSLDPEVEARYEKLKARDSKPRPPAPNLDTPQHSNSCSNDSNLNSNSNSNSISWCTRAQGDSNSSPSERTSSRTFMASPSHRFRSISPPLPRSCFCGSPKKLLKTLNSKKIQPSQSSRFCFRAKPQLKSNTAIDKSPSPSKGSIVKDKYKGGFQELDCLSDEEFLTDLTTFSLKSQEKHLKKAVQEEHKVNNDAEELVKWVKQASARMDVSVVDDDDFLSDEEEELKKH